MQIDAKQIGRLLHRMRRLKGYSLREMAAKAECSASFLSQIELGKTSPSLDSLARICGALDMTVVEFLQMRHDRTDPILRRGCEPSQLVRKWRAASLHHLLPLTEQIHFSILVLDIPARGKTPFRSARRAMKEIGVVLRGTVAFEVGGETHTLTGGDAVYFDLARAHRWRNTGTQPARLLLLNPNFTEVDDYQHRISRARDRRSGDTPRKDAKP